MQDTNPCASIVFEAEHELRDFTIYRDYDPMSLGDKISMRSFCWCGSQFAVQIGISSELIYSYDDPINQMISILYQSFFANLDEKHDTDATRYQFDKAMNLAAQGQAEKGKLHMAASIKAEKDHLYEAPPEVSASAELSTAAKGLPGYDYMIGCPAEGHSIRVKEALGSIIIHLNDYHRWTREQIAEWLENIHDPTGENGPNLAFQTKEES